MRITNVEPRSGFGPLKHQANHIFHQASLNPDCAPQAPLPRIVPGVILLPGKIFPEKFPHPENSKREKSLSPEVLAKEKHMRRIFQSRTASNSEGFWFRFDEGLSLTALLRVCAGHVLQDQFRFGHFFCGHFFCETGFQKLTLDGQTWPVFGSASGGR